MNSNRRGANKGFSLVELLAVVMILAVLSAIAIPLYINSRKAAAARTCIANLTTIASAETAFATRNGTYAYDASVGSGKYVCETGYNATTPTSGGLVGAPEGLSNNLLCPLDGTAHYTVTETTPGTSKDCVIRCTNDTVHAGVVGVATNYTKTLVAPISEKAP